MSRFGSDSFPRPYGKYELLERIGDGGMAEVFRARHVGAAGFEKIVVIKKILPHLSYRKQVVQMFVQEAKLTAEAQHKNIVQVYELAEHEGDFFMVMEYIKGTDLRRLLKSAAKRSVRMPPWFSVQVMIDVLDGLSFVHELTDDRGRARNVVHRDVTPSNIFISQRGEVKLGDFGIAKDATQGSMTQTGQLKGKVPYMSPEQLFSEPIDQRADVFAAGVVLWECLAQRRLFGGRPDVAAMKLICSTDPRKPPSACVPDIPRELDACVVEAIAVDPKKRTPSARELQSRLIDLMPKLAKTVRPQEVQRVVETLMGMRPKEEAPPPGVTHLAIDTDHDFIGGDDTEADEPVPERPPPGGKLESLRAANGMSGGSPATDLDLSFERSRLSKPATGVRADIPPSLSVSTANPRFSTPIPIPRADSITARGHVDSGPNTPATAALAADLELDGGGGGDTPDWLVTGPHMHDRVHPEVSSRAGGFGPQRWAAEGAEPEAYDGPHPFWLESSDNKKLGPISLERALELVRAEAGMMLGPNAKISADGASFMPLSAFAALTGQEGVLYDDTAKLVETPGSTLGYLDERSMISVLAWIGRDRLTGKLSIAPEGIRRAVYREIHVVRGAPVFIFANEESLQLPEVLVTKKVITKKMIPEVVHESLRAKRSLDELIAERFRGAKYRVMMLKERMNDILRWEMGRFLFDPQAALVQGPPLARSMLLMIPELVHRGFTTEELRGVMKHRIDGRFAPAAELEAGIAELGFSDVQKDAAHRIAKGKKLSALIKLAPQEEKILLLVAYVLVEMQLLIQI